MKVLIACDKFRGALTSHQANQAIMRSIVDLFPNADIVSKNLADGGEGTAFAFCDAWGGEILTCQTSNAFGEEISVEWAWVKDKKTAIIEISAIAGHFNLFGKVLDPLRASTYGLGEVIATAIEKGAEKIVIGLGGSVTIDAGAGVLEALGARFLSSQGDIISRPAGADLSQIASLDLGQLDERLKGVSFLIAVDVDSPLIGPQGAVQMFGVQKGLKADQFTAFEEGLSHFDRILSQAIGGDTLSEHRGAGAAGGVYIGLSALGNVQVCNGFDLLSEAYDLATLVQKSDLIFTGEGAFDAQSLVGKGTGELVKLAQKYEKPIIVFAGNVGVSTDDLKSSGIQAIFPIAPRPMQLDDALQNAELYLEQTARNVIATFGLGCTFVDI